MTDKQIFENEIKCIIRRNDGKPDFDYDTSIKILNFIDDLQKQRKEDKGK